MKTMLYFVRHAEPDYSNHDDWKRPLTEKGLEDRKLATAFLSHCAIDAVLSSPYQRAVDTVKHFADSRGFEISIIEDFRERKIDTVWIEDFESFAKRQWEDFDYKRSGGESLREVQVRNVKAVRQVLTEYAGRNVAVGSHGTALSTLINFYDSSFGYRSFQEIKSLMPWIVCFTFEDLRCTAIQKLNVFDPKVL